MLRKALYSLLLAVIVLLNHSPAANGEIVDKIVAVVNGKIITLSDIRKEHEIQLAIGGKAETDKETLNSLIDQSLLEEDMSQYPGLGVTDDEIEMEMKLVSDTHGVALSEIRAANVRKLQRKKYLYLRFGQFIVVSNEEIESFYNNEFVPEVKRQGLMPPELKLVEMQIRQNLSDQKLSQELEDSLMELRTRSTTSIEIL